MKHRIVIDLYDHTEADEVSDILESLESLGFSTPPRYEVKYGGVWIPAASAKSGA